MKTLSQLPSQATFQVCLIIQHGLHTRTDHNPQGLKHMQTPRLIAAPIPSMILLPTPAACQSTMLLRMPAESLNTNPLLRIPVVSLNMRLVRQAIRSPTASMYPKRPRTTTCPPSQTAPHLNTWASVEAQSPSRLHLRHLSRLQPSHNKRRHHPHQLHSPPSLSTTKSPQSPR